MLESASLCVKISRTQALGLVNWNSLKWGVMCGGWLMLSEKPLSFSTAHARKCSHTTPGFHAKQNCKAEKSLKLLGSPPHHPPPHLHKRTLLSSAPQPSHQHYNSIRHSSRTRRATRSPQWHHCQLGLLPLWSMLQDLFPSSRFGTFNSDLS